MEREREKDKEKDNKMIDQGGAPLDRPMATGSRSLLLCTINTTTNTTTTVAVAVVVAAAQLIPRGDEKKVDKP